MRRKLICIALTIAMLICLAACGSTATESSDPSDSTSPSESGNGVPDDWVKLELSYSTYLPEMNPNMQLYKHWITTLEKHMPGLITINFFPSGTLLSQSDTYEGVVTGTADIAVLDIGSAANLFPLSKIWSYPSISVANATAASAAFTEWVWKYRPAEYDDVVFLFGQALGPLDFVTNFEVKDPSDLAGKQIRATMLGADIVSAYGAIPVTLESSELYEASRSGLIDGAYYGVTTAMLQGMTEFCNYCIKLDMGTPTYAYIMNKDTFNRMPESQQEAFKKAFAEAFFEYMLPQVNTRLNQHKETMHAIGDKKINFFMPDAGTLEKFHKPVAGLLDDYVAELEAKGIDAKTEVERIQELTEKWNNWFPFEKSLEPMVIAATEGTEAYEAYKAEHWNDPLPEWPEIYGYTPTSAQAYPIDYPFE